MTERLGGRLSWWTSEPRDDFGYITPDDPHEGQVVVFKNELLHARIAPVIGTRVSFEHGVAHNGVSAAVRVQLADRPAPVSPEPLLVMRPDSPAQAETKSAARGKIQ